MVVTSPTPRSWSATGPGSSPTRSTRFWPAPASRNRRSRPRVLGRLLPERSRSLPQLVAVRDSEQPDGAKLVVSKETWWAFIRDVQPRLLAQPTTPPTSQLPPTLPARPFRTRSRGVAAEAGGNLEALRPPVTTHRDTQRVGCGNTSIWVTRPHQYRPPSRLFAVGDKFLTHGGEGGASLACARLAWRCQGGGGAPSPPCERMQATICNQCRSTT
jgi:hypothetical protein